MGKRVLMAITMVVAIVVIAGLGYYFYYGARPPTEAMKPEVKNITHS